MWLRKSMLDPLFRKMSDRQEVQLIVLGSKVRIPEAQVLRFLATKLANTSCNKLDPDVSTYWHKEFTEGYQLLAAIDS